MKLYFYVFSDGEIKFSECEVEEKPKSYKLIGIARGFYGVLVLKSEIGLKKENEWKQIVVLEKRDDELAKKYLSDYLNKEKDKMQAKIDELKEKLEYVSEWELTDLQPN